MTTMIDNLMRELQYFALPDPVITDVERKGHMFGTLNFTAKILDWQEFYCAITYDVETEEIQDMASFNGLNDQTLYDSYTQYEFITKEKNLVLRNGNELLNYGSFYEVRCAIYVELRKYIDRNIVDLTRGL